MLYLEGKIILLSNLRLKFSLYEVQLSVPHAFLFIHVDQAMDI